MQDLIERLEKATGLEPELNRDIALAVIPDALPREQDCWISVPSEMERDQRQIVLPHPYTLSLDSAMTLVPKGMAPVIAMTGVWADHTPWAGQPIWEAAFPDRGTEDFEEYTIAEIGDFEICGQGPTPAIALCIAALKARAAQIGRQ